MELFFLILLLAAFLGLKYLFDNILWIGTIVIIIVCLTIVRAFFDYKEFGFEFFDLIILLLKIGLIAGVVYLMRM